jgi:transcriptional regulator with XRE-family HTH domain
LSELKEIRLAAGLNQRQLSEASHTPQALISAIERGVLKPWPKVAARLSKALNTRVESLFPEDAARLQAVTKKDND